MASRERSKVMSNYPLFVLSKKECTRDGLTWEEITIYAPKGSEHAFKTIQGQDRWEITSIQPVIDLHLSPDGIPLPGKIYIIQRPMPLEA
jgi:hypothetical protein